MCSTGSKDLEQKTVNFIERSSSCRRECLGPRMLLCSSIKGPRAQLVFKHPPACLENAHWPVSAVRPSPQGKLILTLRDTFHCLLLGRSWQWLMHATAICLVKKDAVWSLRASLVVKGIGCSYNGSRSYSQRPHDSSQPPVTPVSGHLTPCSDLQRH